MLQGETTPQGPTYRLIRQNYLPFKHLYSIFLWCDAPAPGNCESRRSATLEHISAVGNTWEIMIRCAALVRFCLLLLFVSPCMAQQSPIVKVTIESKWGGLGTASQTEEVISRERDGYRGKHDRIDARTVESLLAALSEPRIAAPEPLNLGINQAWLDANAISAVEKYAGNFDGAAPNQKALFQTSFSDESLIRRVVPNFFNFSRTDDYPSTKVEVTFEDGSTVSALSTSQYLFMLPWKVKWGSEEITTYNAAGGCVGVVVLPEGILAK